MRKRFLMVVALMVALSVPLRLSALAADASEELPVEASEDVPVDVSEVHSVEDLPAELFSVDSLTVSDVSWLNYYATVNDNALHCR